MSLKIREATPEDATGITDVNCSDVKKWYKMDGKKRIKAKYEDLTPYDRWRHGGPWMDSTLCRKHLEKNRAKYGMIPLVAIFGDRCVGEAEFIYCNEPEPYFKYAYLTTLVVHKESRRRGIGTNLVKECMRIARKAGSRFFDTVPEDENSVRLYSRLGLMKWREFPVMFMPIRENRINLEGMLVGLEEGFNPIEDYTVIVDHWYPAKYTWGYLFDQEYRRFHSAKDLKVFRLNLDRHELIVALDHWMWNRDAGRLILLIKPYSSLKEKELRQMATVVKELSIEMGFRSLDARGVDTAIISKKDLESLGFSGEPAIKTKSFLYLRGTTKD